MRPAAEEGQPLHDHIPIYFIAAYSTPVRRPHATPGPMTELTVTVYKNPTEHKIRLAAVFEMGALQQRRAQRESRNETASVPSLVRKPDQLFGW